MSLCVDQSVISSFLVMVPLRDNLSVLHKTIVNLVACGGRIARLVRVELQCRLNGRNYLL